MERPRSVQSRDLTPLLARWQRGDSDAFDRVIDAAHGELKRLAPARLLREGQGHTLETTGLVHEAWMRLVRVEHVSWNDRNHFLSMASRIIRRILIDHARRRYAQKRDGESGIERDDEPLLLSAGQATTVLELDQAIEHLEAAWDQMDTRISPDGTLAAYVSSESGQLQIVVQAFPQAGRIWRVSEADTAYSPRWAADGRSLYFWVLSDTSPDTLFQTQIHRNGPDLRIDTPEPVLTMSVAGGIRNDGVWWDVDPSGGGFVIAVTEDLTGGRSAGDERRYVIVQNWLTELKERLEQARR